MKTKFIQALADAPIKFLRKCRVTRRPFVVTEESKIATGPSSFSEHEEYLLSVTFSTKFFRQPHEPEAARCEKYVTAKMALVNAVYGETAFAVRHLLFDIEEINDLALHTSLTERIEEILETITI